MATLSPPRPADLRSGLVVHAPGRLHLGFLDPSGSLGRRFGSLGLVIEGFQTRVEMRLADVDQLGADNPAASAELGRAAECLRRLRAGAGRHQPLALQLHEVLPAHAGFGSGTQLALAIGRAFAGLHGLDVATPMLARWTGRGARSGIGIAGFDVGGLLVDGGPGADGEPAPLIARVTLPEAWRIVVVLDGQRRGLSGPAEATAMQTLAPLARAQAADICHQVLMRVLPGAAADTFDLFATGVNQVQAVLGQHFAAAQGDSAWTSPAVARCMAWLRGAVGDGAAIGQSSWGPTGFAIVPSAAMAQDMVRAARAAGVVGPSLALHIVAACDRGAVVTDPRAH